MNNIAQELRLLASRIESDPAYLEFTDIRRFDDQILSMCLGDEQDQKGFALELTEYLTNSYRLIMPGSFVRYQGNIAIVLYQNELPLPEMPRYTWKESFTIWQLRDRLVVSSIDSGELAKLHPGLVVNALLDLIKEQSLE